MLTMSEQQMLPLEQHEETVSYESGDFVRVDLSGDLDAGLRRACKGTGVVLLGGIPDAPLDKIRELLDAVAARPDIQDRVNEAYQATGAKKLVWKDSFATGRGGDSVDQKRVLDLAAHRIAAIEKVQRGREIDEPLTESLEFFHQVEQAVVPKLLEALGTTGQVPLISEEHDWLTAYRMVDYYARPSDSRPPRCGEHRDFGTLTLIFQDGMGGLEVQVGDKWVPVPPKDTVLLFGWCSKVRSNDRIPAALHRVVDSPVADKNSVVPRRTTAILFVAPGADASVAPVVLPGESTHYGGLKKAGDLKGIMARKWEFREGTIDESQIAAEVEERRRFKTQDDIVAHVLKTQNDQTI